MRALLFSFGLCVAICHAEEWVVRLPAHVDAQAFARAHQVRYLRTLGNRKRYALYEGVLKSIPPQIQVQPNFQYRPMAEDPQLSASWGLYNVGQADGEGQLGIPGVDIGGPYDGAPVSVPLVAVLDSGVDRSHPELKSKLWRNPYEIEGNGIDDDANGYVDDINGWNFVGRTADISDDNNHGTLVAGIVAARAGNGEGSRGVADAVQVMAVKCTDKYGIGTTATAIEALEYAVKNGARVLNASWGGTEYDPALYETIQWAGTEGALLVAAAGNQGANHDLGLTSVYPAAFGLEGIIAVAAYDNRNRLWEKSDYGGRTVHLGAPGVSIFGPRVGGYGYGTGTSFAAPFVSGALAALRSQTDLPALGLKARLLKSTEVIGYYEKNKLITAGRLHLGNALTGRFPARPVGPTDWTASALRLGTPHPYPNGFKKLYKVAHPGAKRLRVHFSKLSTEQKFDWIELRDREKQVIVRYSGEKEGWSAEALGDELWITFHSDAVTNGYGFEIDKYEASFSPHTWSTKKNSPKWGVFLPSLFRGISIQGFTRQTAAGFGVSQTDL